MSALIDIEALISLLTDRLSATVAEPRYCPISESATAQPAVRHAAKFWRQFLRIPSIAKGQLGKTLQLGIMVKWVKLPERRQHRVGVVQILRVEWRELNTRGHFSIAHMLADLRDIDRKACHEY